MILFRVHISVDEKISLTAGRDGGLQNMEVRGLILLRISDAEYGRITIAVENDDQLGFQLQVHIILRCMCRNHVQPTI